MTTELKSLQECTSAALPAFIDLVDAEFLRARGRSGSALDRYPSLFDAHNLNNLHTAWYGEQLAGTVAVKEFKLEIGTQNIDGAMLGFVCVNPVIRGQGVGSKLVAHVTQLLASKELSFSVLWTTRPDFYQRFGWKTNDQGVIGELSSPKKLDESISPKCLMKSWQLIEEIRLNSRAAKVQRVRTDYSVVPCPVNEVFCFLKPGKTDGAYAIVGSNGSTGIVYELVGQSAQFPVVWSDVCGRFSRILINDCVGTPSYQWLSQNTDVNWKLQNQAMWILGPNSGSVSIEQLYVPYFDRI
jgi:N-acetylglutamate synthase-like GNAT family acetyltransferase